MLRTLGDERLVDVTILNCFWYHMYLNGSPKVMDWIKEKGIFSKTYIFVPIVDGGHWNLLILCNLGKSFNNNYSPFMILLDSLIISEPLKAEPTIRRFVKDLFHTQGKMASSRSIGSIPLLLPKERDGRGSDESRERSSGSFSSLAISSAAMVTHASMWPLPSRLPMSTTIPPPLGTWSGPEHATHTGRPHPKSAS
ncbi:hypothetical protein Taro_049715 [Colocasia esculenta]|uniref:Ubiquitin-like protease family profile domain-containing protein n=1 Tax=Colocasia esculenta TaxID=4460 RepID=A0A843XBQ6_COLES|nr:hypothetical protein [Colocasia esculenta]